MHMIRHAIGATLTLAALTLAFLPSGHAEAAGANATWVANEGQAHIKIEPCNANICGTIVWLAEPNDRDTGKAKLDKNNPEAALRSRPILGLHMLTAHAEQEGQWRGTIYNGQNGRTYDVTIRMEGEKLNVQGCVLGGLICSTQSWVRFSQ